MAEIFRMPKLGMDMEEGVVIKWLKAEGDTVKKGEPLAEIETDKSSVEVESPADGIVRKLFCAEDTALPCGTPIAFIGSAEDAIPDVNAAEAQETSAPVAETPVAAGASNDLFFCMPKLGMDMEEGTIMKWLKAEGDEVKKGEPLAEIETDKSSVEVESPFTGIVRKLFHPEDTSLPCGTPIAFIGTADEPIPQPGAATAEAPASPAAPATAGASNDLFFCMPKLGMDMEEGTIMKWLKAEGDEVKKGEPLAEIETDKSSVEVESPFTGIVRKLFHPEDTSLPCGTPIAFIGTADEPIPQPGAATAEMPAAPAAPAIPAPQAATPVAAPAAKPAAVANPVAALTPGGRIRSSPRARRLAAQNQIDLALISGTGSAGRIVEADVRAYMAQPHAAVPAAKVCRIPTETVEPLTGVRKVTARRMRQSLSNSAQTNHRVDVDVTNLMNFRKQVNARLEKDGIKVSIVDILAMACARALIEHPLANASLMEDGLHMRNFANVGIACDTPKGLMVPVIHDADVLSITEMAQSSRAIINKARKGELKPDDMSGGTFTISNLGMFEIDSFTAVLNPPETCILAVGRIVDRVVAENGQMVIRPMMNLCLTYDHQILDGAPAAQFLQTIKHYIENPVWLVV